MECAVPPLVLKQLEADLASGGVNEVQIRIDWAAPDDDTFYYGRVDSVRWSCSIKTAASSGNRRCGHTCQRPRARTRNRAALRPSHRRYIRVHRPVRAAHSR